jgi:hypothetical protein
VSFIELITQAVTGSQMLSAILIWLVLVLIMFFIRANTFTISAIAFLSGWGLWEFGLPLPFAMIATIVPAVLYYFMFKDIVN